MEKLKLIKTICLISTFLVMGLCGTASYVFGANITGDGEGDDNNWSTGANWVGDVVPSKSDRVVFDNTSSKLCTVE